MAQELIDETLKDVAKFVEEFGVLYIQTLLNTKIDDAIAEVIQGVMPQSGEDESANEEKGLADKLDDVKPIAAGATLVSYKLAWGPDRVEHRYYDMACWNVKPKNSVIVNVTFRHRQLLGFFNSIKKKIPAANAAPFPQKKNVWKKR